MQTCQDESRAGHLRFAVLRFAVKVKKLLNDCYKPCETAGAQLSPLLVAAQTALEEQYACMPGKGNTYNVVWFVHQYVFVARNFFSLCVPSKTLSF